MSSLAEISLVLFSYTDCVAYNSIFMIMETLPGMIWLAATSISYPLQQVISINPHPLLVVVKFCPLSVCLMKFSLVDYYILMLILS